MIRLTILLLLSLSLAAPSRAQAGDWRDRVAKLESAQGPALDQLKKELIAGGMSAHEALKQGSESTATARSDLRKAIRAQRDAAACAKGLLMHEWGSLSYSQGVDSAKIDTHQETSDLPPFVQVWSQLARQAARPVPPSQIIVRKPIVYFYTDKPQTLTFSVACPHGMFTQWFPKAWRVNPDPAELGPDFADAGLTGGIGLLVWKNFDLVPGPLPALPAVPETAWWWPICRDTDSTPINAGGVFEKFLFYRGIVSDVPAAIDIDGGAQKKYTITNTRKGDPVEHLFLVYVSAGKAIAKYIPSIAPGEKQIVDLALTADAQAVADFAPQMRQRMAECLEEAGLFPKESAGMTQIWQKDWFETDGVRVIYLNPAAATASLMPLKIDPAPVESIRTYLISIECLQDSKENVIKEMILNLGDNKYSVREAAQRQLIQFGKQTEPALREALQKTEDEEVRNRINVILQKIDPRP